MIRNRVGIDLVKISRMEDILSKEKDSFIDRVLTPGEREYVFASSSESRRAEHLAGRFAAKEAASKALGTGVMSDGVAFTDFEIIPGISGAPTLHLRGRAREVADSMGVISTSVSITHEGEYAAAFCSFLTDEEDS